ncbi:hypothetical protein U3A58_10355 [Algoriphagus sp. C2-6-M1]|uniref:hypothetical protein n=1 Tax=Algoriphagus persicinus TaxID=3108754 RepID=UPI002B3CA1BD|nr:hypothetical protein [Algoriphagus sp. C2-6-M1]MEB2780795.1 hypothetical protein [Algoriphagus sp. C2-6-M1]
MGNGDYINKLLNGVRGDKVLHEKETVEVTEHLEKSPDKKASSDINNLLENMRNFEIEGDSKRLIRMDARTEEVLKLLNPMFRVDVTSFVNFLCWEFLEKNPERINEIKQSLKKL